MSAINLHYDLTHRKTVIERIIHLHLLGALEEAHGERKIHLVSLFGTCVFSSGPVPRKGLLQPHVRFGALSGVPADWEPSFPIDVMSRYLNTLHITPDKHNTYFP